MLYARYALWAAAAGLFIPLMAVLNARLGRSLGAPIQAPVVLFIVAAIFASAVSLAFSGKLPSSSGLMTTSPVNLLGGVIVGFYVVSVTLLAPRFGVGNAILFVMVAQIISSAAIDHLGLLGVQVRPLDLRRITGLTVLVTGLVITQIAPNSGYRAKPTAFDAGK